MRTATCLTVIAFGVLFGVPRAHAQLLDRLERTLDRINSGTPAATDDALPAPIEDDRPTLGLSTNEDGEPGGGVLIASVVTDSPAAKAGLRKGDLIKQANGKPVNSANELGEALQGAKVGDRATFTIRSVGRDRKVELVFASQSPRADVPREPAPAPAPAPGPAPATGPEGADSLADPADPLNPGRPFPPLPRRDPADEEPAAELSGRPTLGVSVGPVTDDAAARYGVPTRRGALITRVTPEGPADRAGLPVGGVVVAVDGVRIDTADQLVDAIRTSSAGQEIELSYYNGTNMSRKTVRLGSAGPAPAGIGEPSPRTNRIEPGPAPAFDPIASQPPVGGSDEVAALRQEVLQLRDQLRALQERLDRLERSPAADNPAGEDEDAAASPPRFAPPPPTP